MLRGAGATQALRLELDRLSGASVRSSRVSQSTSRDIDGVAKSAGRADRSINQLTGRLRLFADLAATLGPALVPLGGVGLVGVTALANQMGVAAVAGGVLIGSMQGLGDALSALNDAHLEPTAENLVKAEDALNRLSPAAADFAREAYGMLPALRAIRDMGAEGLFPGLSDSLDSLERLAPTVGRIFQTVGAALGDIASGGAASLASDRWADFFDFIAREAPRTLTELAAVVGDVTHGLSELWEQFAPLNRGASSWMRDIAEGFDRWATGLSQTQGFQDFIAYIQQNGPLVADTLGSLANAVVQVVQAAAPLGGPTLMAIRAVADVLATLADSGGGTALLAAAAGMAAFSRAASLLTKAKALSLASLNPWVLAVGATAGVLLSVEQKADAAAGAIDRFNEALAAGDTGSARDSLAEMERRLESLRGTDMASISFSSFGNLMEGRSVADEIAELERNIASAKGELEAFDNSRERGLAAWDAYNAAIDEQTAALHRNISAMQAKRDEALRSFSAETNYAQSLLDAKDALEQNGRAWNLTTEAGVANRRVVEQQASAWNELNRTQGQTPEQARRARKALIDTAMDLGATREQARRYANELLDIPTNVKTDVELRADQAREHIRAVKAELASIDRSIDVYVNIRRPNAGGFGPQATTSADGGTVPKTGMPYADRHLYLLADGEEVISNRHGQADRWRPMLKAINGGLAEGGTAGRRRFNAAEWVPDRTEALQAAIDRLTLVAQDQTTAVEDQTRRTDEWSQRMSDVAQATVAGFNTGLFERDSNPWAAGAGGGSFANLSRDIAGLQQRGALQAQLAAAGLDGDALAAALSQGSNADLSALLASGQVQGFEDLYNQRAALQSSVGAAAGQAAYGQQFAAANAEAARQTAILDQLESQLATANAQLERHSELLATVGDRAGAAAGGAVVTNGNRAARRRRRDG